MNEDLIFKLYYRIYDCTLNTVECYVRSFEVDFKNFYFFEPHKIIC